MSIIEFINKSKAIFHMAISFRGIVFTIILCRKTAKEYKELFIEQTIIRNRQSSLSMSFIFRRIQALGSISSLHNNIRYVEIEI